MEPLRYFAYGSNLLFARLHARCPSIENVGIARLVGYRLSFDKPGGDGSGKCGITEGGAEEQVLGVLYAISAEDKEVLDRIEGVGFGYEAMDTTVIGGVEDGDAVDCFTYVPTVFDDTLLPYHWYRDFVLFGARENNFPAEWIARIEAVSVQADPDEVRSAANRLILDTAATAFATNG